MMSCKKFFLGYYPKISTEELFKRTCFLIFTRDKKHILKKITYYCSFFTCKVVFPFSLHL